LLIAFMKKVIAAVAALLLLFNQNVLAGWPIGKHHYILSSSLAQYIAKNRWDANGYFVSGGGQTFNATTLGFNVAYGLSRRVDVSASLPVVYQRITYPGGAVNNTSLGDMQVGASFMLANFKYSNYISLYVGAAVPLYTNTSTRYIGLGNGGAITRLSNSGSLSQKTSYNIDLGFSQYFGTGAPRQYLVDVTLGYAIDRWNQLGFSGGAGRSVSSDKRSLSNLLANRDFEYVRLAGSYGHSFTKRVNVNLLFFYTVAGRNTGEGYGGALSLSYKLPYR
jgi:protein XagA